MVLDETTGKRVSTEGNQPGHRGSPPGRVKERPATAREGGPAMSNRGEEGEPGKPREEQFPVMRLPLSCHMRREVEEEG